MARRNRPRRFRIRIPRAADRLDSPSGDDPWSHDLRLQPCRRCFHHRDRRRECTRRQARRTQPAAGLRAGSRTPGRHLLFTRFGVGGGLGFDDPRGNRHPTRDDLQPVVDPGSGSRRRSALARDPHLRRGLSLWRRALDVRRRIGDAESRPPLRRQHHRCDRRFVGRRLCPDSRLWSASDDSSSGRNGCGRGRWGHDVRIAPPRIRRLRPSAWRSRRSSPRGRYRRGTV